MSILDIILWFAVRIAIFGSLIAVGVFAALGIIWLRKRKHSKTKQPQAK